MAEKGADGSSREDETAKLELPSLSLKGLGRKRRRPADPAPVEAERETAPEPRATSVVAEPEPSAAEPEPLVADEPEPLVADEPETRVAAPEPLVEEPSPRVREVHTEREEPEEFEEEPGLSAPRLSGWLAALLTGVLVGVVGVLLTYASLRGCDAVRGAKSCGGGPGLLLLVVILGVMVVLGAVVLTALRVAEPRSTSFLGIGVLAVVALLALTDRLSSAWMLLVVPAVTGAAYVLAHRVATAFIEPSPEPGPEHDVR
jgi:hypothetical protein